MPHAGDGSHRLRLDELALPEMRVGSVARISRLRYPAAIAGSFLLHASAALILLLTFSSDRGRSKSQSESISIEVVETLAVEGDLKVSNHSPPATSMAQQAMSAAEDPKAQPDPDEKPSPQAQEPPTIDQSQWPKLALQTAPEVPPLISDRVIAPMEPDGLEQPAVEPRKTEPPRPVEQATLTPPVDDPKKPDRPEREPVKDLARKTRQEKHEGEKRKGERAEQTQAASVASRGAAKNSAGRTSASQGDVVSYRALVQTRVASRRPAANGHHGTAVISFGISGGGSVTFATLSSSSGSSELDRAALAAVRSAGPFPPTPNHAPLSFSFPFYFR